MPRWPSRQSTRHAVRADAEALRAEARGAAPAARPSFPVQRVERRRRGDPRPSCGGTRHAARPHGLSQAFARRHQPDRSSTVEAEVGGARSLSAGCSRRASATVCGRGSHGDPTRHRARIASFLLQPLVRERRQARPARARTGCRHRHPRAWAIHAAYRDRQHRRARGGATQPDAVPGSASRTCAGALALHYPGRHRFTLHDRGEGTDKGGRDAACSEGEPCPGPDRRRRASGAPGDAAPAGRASRRRDRRRGGNLAEAMDAIARDRAAARLPRHRAGRRGRRLRPARRARRDRPSWCSSPPMPSTPSKPSRSTPSTTSLKPVEPERLAEIADARRTTARAAALPSEFGAGRTRRDRAQDAQADRARRTRRDRGAARRRRFHPRLRRRPADA